MGDGDPVGLPGAPDLDRVPGTVSVWLGRLDGPPHLTRADQAPHAAASTMKVAVLAALYRGVDDGTVELAEPVEVRNTFASAVPGATYSCVRRHDSDEQVWRRLGEVAPLGWLARRMIVRSSNLATNLVLERIGLGAVAQVWRSVGAANSSTPRGISDDPATAAGLRNLVSAADLAALLRAITASARSEPQASPAARRPESPASARSEPQASPASPASTVDHPLVGAGSAEAMLEILGAQEMRDDLVAGLPPGTRVAVKNGWITGVRHAAGVVFPDDAPPFVLAVCTTTPWARNRPDDDACRLVAAITRSAWAARHDLATPARGACAPRPAASP
jgi:beta-lactamase class A